MLSNLSQSHNTHVAQGGGGESMWTLDRRERKAGVRCSFFFVCFVDRKIVAEEWICEPGCLWSSSQRCARDRRRICNLAGWGKKPGNASGGMESEEAYLQLSGCLFCASDQAARNPSKGMSSGTPRFVSLLVWFSSSSPYKEFQLIERIEPRSIYFLLVYLFVLFFNE